MRRGFLTHSHSSLLLVIYLCWPLGFRQSLRTLLCLVYICYHSIHFSSAFIMHDPRLRHNLVDIKTKKGHVEVE